MDAGSWAAQNAQRSRIAGRAVRVHVDGVRGTRWRTVYDVRVGRRPRRQCQLSTARIACDDRHDGGLKHIRELSVAAPNRILGESIDAGSVVRSTGAQVGPRRGIIGNAVRAEPTRFERNGGSCTVPERLCKRDYAVIPCTELAGASMRLK